MEQYSTKLCGECFKLSPEEQQENSTYEYLKQQTTQEKSRKDSSFYQNSSKVGKSVFSFKNNCLDTKGQGLTFILAGNVKRQTSQLPSKQLRKQTQIIRTKYFSPEIRFNYSPNLKPVFKMQPSIESMDLYSPRLQRLPNSQSNFYVQNKLNIPNSQIIGKPRKIIDQQTQYSSKESQKIKKYTSENIRQSIKFTDETFTNNQRKYIKQYQQQQQFFGSQNYYSQSRSLIHSQHLFSNKNSAVAPQLTKMNQKYLNAGVLLEFKQNSLNYEKVNQMSVLASPAISPRDKGSPKKIKFNKVDEIYDPNLFQSQQHRLKYTPKISVLNLQERSHNQVHYCQQELKDRISNNLLKYQPSIANSLKVSQRSSLKHMPQPFENPFKKQACNVNIPQHSRQNSWQTGLFNAQLKMRRTLTRTLTVTSKQSQNSIVDMKFRQKYQLRKQLSRLISN